MQAQRIVETYEREVESMLSLLEEMEENLDTGRCGRIAWLLTLGPQPHAHLGTTPLIGAHQL